MNTKALIPAFLILLSLLNLDVNAQQSEEEQIRRVLTHYIEGRNTGDIERLKKAFHPTATLKFIDSKNMDLAEWTLQEYTQRLTPGKKLNCEGQITDIRIFNDAAQATVLLTYPTSKFHDYMSLLKVRGEWLIVDKTFARKPTPGKVLIAVTSHSGLGDTGRKQGLYLKEVSHVYKALEEAGYSVDFVSPEGKISHIYGQDLNDSITAQFVQNEEAWSRLHHNSTPEKIDPKNYKAMYFAGGHGTMWDFPENVILSILAAEIYEDSGIVAAICHGSVGLLNVTLSDGSPLVRGKRVTGFTDNEEKEIKMDRVVPLLLETELKKKGGLFVAENNWTSNVQTDQRIITGQNAQSVEAFAKVLVKSLDQQNNILEKKSSSSD